MERPVTTQNCWPSHSPWQPIMAAMLCAIPAKANILPVPSRVIKLTLSGVWACPVPQRHLTFAPEITLCERATLIV